MDTNPETEVTGDAVAEAQLEALFSKGAKEEPQDDNDTPEEADSPEVSDDQSETEPAEEEWEDVDLDGEALRVPKTKAEKLKQALQERLMQADYTRKTQAVAERQRAVELQEKRVQLVGQAQSVLGQKQAEIVGLAQQLQRYEELNWSQLSAEQAYPLIVERDQLRAKLNAKQTEFQQQANHFQQSHEATEREWRQKLEELGTARLNEELGGWSEEKKKDAAQRIFSIGYQPEEINSVLVYDPRFLRLAWEASQYQKLQATKAETITKKTANAKPFVPTAARGIQKSQADSKAVELRDRMKKSGKAEDVEAFLAARFSKRK